MKYTINSKHLQGRRVLHYVRALLPAIAQGRPELLRNYHQLDAAEELIKRIDTAEPYLHKMSLLQCLSALADQGILLRHEASPDTVRQRIEVAEIMDTTTSSGFDLHTGRYNLPRTPEGAEALHRFARERRDIGFHGKLTHRMYSMFHARCRCGVALVSPPTNCHFTNDRAPPRYQPGEPT